MMEHGIRLASSGRELVKPISAKDVPGACGIFAKDVQEDIRQLNGHVRGNTLGDLERTFWPVLAGTRLMGLLIKTN